MSGAVTAVGDAEVHGWASIEEDRTYSPVVHLVAGDDIIDSTLAVRRGEGTGEAPAEALTHRFHFDLSASSEMDKGAYHVMLAETGEVLDGLDSVATRSTRRPASTYRDALDLGLSPEDILGAFYLDFLRRPPDGEALKQFSFQAKADPVAVFDRWRNSLLCSEEYKARTKRTADGVGQIFSSAILPRTSQRVRDFEGVLPAFVEATSLRRESLIEFFPGLLHEDKSVAEIARYTEAGLPSREIFFRALAAVAHRPSLILDRRALNGSARRGANDIPDGSGVIVVPCRSALFVSGWHKLEGDGTGARRWMEQIGVIQAPADLPVTSIEVEIAGTYFDAGRLMAASEQKVLCTEVVAKESGIVLKIGDAQGLPFRLRRLVIVAETARCPWRHQGQPDPRLLSILVHEARFFTEKTI